MNAGADQDALLGWLEALLRSGMLQTEWQQRAWTSEEVNRVVSRLQQLGPTDYHGKLRVAGFTVFPYQPPGEDPGVRHSCATCMYYEVHRQFCALPELELPVRPEWSCRLWRI